ncbi:MAG: hypothetical protein EBZ47_01835 [Chlamydiae bacterium]|nr:hypothetical protein [Chlamydiota bacterium]
MGKFFLFSIFSLCLSSLLLAEELQTKEDSTQPFHIFASTGYAWGMNSGIANPQPGFWDIVDNGYNQNMGNVSYLSLGFGYCIKNALDVNFNYNLYDTFHYQMLQTSSLQQTGTVRVRYFDLNHQNALITSIWYPYKKRIGGSSWKISPLLGMGIGVGISQVSNFYTVGNNANGTLANVPYTQTVGLGSITSEGNPVTTIAFAWQGIGGIHLEANKYLYLDLSYRYYNGGKFLCPSTIYSFVDQAFFSGSPWKGVLQTNELNIQIAVRF